MLSYRLRESTQEEVMEAAKEVFAERLEDTAVKILKAWGEEAKTRESLLQVIDRLCLRCARLQAEGAPDISKAGGSELPDPELSVQQESQRAAGDRV